MAARPVAWRSLVSMQSLSRRSVSVSREWQARSSVATKQQCTFSGQTIHPALQPTQTEDLPGVGQRRRRYRSASVRWFSSSISSISGPGLPLVVEGWRPYFLSIL